MLFFFWFFYFFFRYCLCIILFSRKFVFGILVFTFFLIVFIRNVHFIRQLVAFWLYFIFFYILLFIRNIRYHNIRCLFIQ